MEVFQINRPSVASPLRAAVRLSVLAILGRRGRRSRLFNWGTAPTFAVMLLFWLLAAYVLTRTPRSLVSLAAAGAEVAAAAFLLGQGMSANAPTEAEWRPWSQNLLWGGMVAPALWYALTALLMREQRRANLGKYLRYVAYPLMMLFGALGLVLVALTYVDGVLFRWTAPEVVTAGAVLYTHFHLRDGPYYWLFMALVIGTTLGAVLNLALAWRSEPDETRRRLFGWLFLSAVLFALGANTLGLASSLRWVGDWAVVPSQLALGAAMIVMIWNVAAYSLLIRGQVVRRDALSFLSSLALVCIVYAVSVVVFVHAELSFRTLGVVVGVLVLAGLSHALVDPARRAVDTLFFSREVQRLRSDLTGVVQDAGLTIDFTQVLEEAQKDLAKASDAHFVRLTEEALRRLNSPAALAGCDLLVRLPGTIAAAAEIKGMSSQDALTPLQQAQLLRESLLAAIERLKPADEGGVLGSPGALQYQILREEYLQGRPNKQIMTRLSVSESTFHRNRRDAIAILARELANQEPLLLGTVLGGA